MTDVAVLFPGQGAQVSGMLHDLPSAGDDVLAAASAVLGIDPLSLDDNTRLDDTTATQLALTLSGIIWYREAASRGLHAQYLCGHSIGLWAAAVCAQSISVADALRVVAIRGDAMTAAAPAGSGMVAISGLNTQEMLELTKDVRYRGLQAWVSVLNSGSDTSVSGDATGLDAVRASAERAGARKMHRLRVAVPGHCPFMQPAADRIRNSLSSIEINNPVVPIAGNVRPNVLTTAAQIREELWRGVVEPVCWGQTTAALHERGVDRWLQLPPGDSLTRLASAFGDPVAAVETVGLAGAVARVGR